jgi:hypothetical protein
VATRVVALTLLTCLACRSHSVNLVSGVPTLVASPPVKLTGGSSDYTLDFGAVAIGTEATGSISLENTGAAPLTITQTAPPTNGEFTLDLGGSVTIPGGGQVPLTARYKPVVAGKHSFAVPLQTDSPAIPVVTITLTGEGMKRNLTVEPQVVDFGGVVVHTTASRTITVTNDSAFSLAITPTLTGTIFTITPTGVFTLAPGASTSITATYAPQVPSAADTAQLTLAPDIGGSIAVSLRGVGLQSALSVSPLALDFNFVSPGQRVTKTVHVRNIGNEPVKVLSVVLAGIGPAATTFSIPTGLPSGSTSARTLQPGDGLDVPVAFAPRNVGLYTNLLQVTASDLGGTTNVAIQGYGGGAAIACAPLALDFGEVGAGVSTTLPVVCTNTGIDVPGHPEAGLQIGSLPSSSSVFGANLSPSALTTPLKPGQGVQIDVSYRPTGTEMDTGTVTVISNVQSAPPPVVQLSGSAVSPGPCVFTLAPAELNFGQVPVSIPGRLAFTVTDVGPNDCYLWQLGYASGSDPVFLPLDVDAGSLWLSPSGSAGRYPSSLSVPVTLLTEKPGNYAGAVSFHISDPGAPNQSVPLAGVVADSCLTLTPSSLEFGTVGLSDGQLCQQGRRSFIANSACASDVQITGVTATPPFTTPALPPLPLTFRAGQASPPLEIGFAPSASGSFFGTVAVQTSLGRLPFDVFLHGTAIDSPQQVDNFVLQPKVDILWVIDNDDDPWIMDPYIYLVYPDGGNSLPDYGPIPSSPALQDFLAAGAGVDYQIGVVNSEVTCGDQGSIEPCPACEVAGDGASWVTPTDPDPAGKLLHEIAGTLTPTPFQGLCSGSESDEELLRAAYLALQPGLLAGHNRGFLRPDARLEIIAVNWDGSENYYGEYDPLPGAAGHIDFLAFFQSLKSSASSVVVDYVDTEPYPFPSPPYDGGWGSNGGGVGVGFPAVSLLALARETGGAAVNPVNVSISAGLQDVWNRTWMSDAFLPLSGAPVPSSLKVYLGGPPPGPGVPNPGTLYPAQRADGTTNWSYQPGPNAIEISAIVYALGPSQPLYVSYMLQCQ